MRMSDVRVPEVCVPDLGACVTSNMAGCVPEPAADKSQGDRCQRKQQPESETREKNAFHTVPDRLVEGVLLVPWGVNETYAGMG